MINKFGKVMIYVNNPRKVADFWIEKIGFTEENIIENENGVFSVELKVNHHSDASIVLLDKKVVEQMSSEVDLATPSIMFSSDNIVDTRNQFIDAGITVGEIVDNGNSKTFNFADIEDNYFVVEETSIK